MHIQILSYSLRGEETICKITLVFNYLKRKDPAKTKNQILYCVSLIIQIFLARLSIYKITIAKSYHSL